MRALIISHTYPTSERPWVTPFIRSFCESLASSNTVETHVLLPDTTGLKSENVLFHTFPISETNKIAYKGIGSSHQSISSLQKARYFIAATLGALSIVHKIKPDIIHAHWSLPSGLIACIVSQRTGIPFVVTTHGRDVINNAEFGYDASSSFLLRTATTLVLKRADAVLTTSSVTEDAVRILASSAKTHLIPVGVDVENFVTIEASSERNSIVFIGDLIERKGVHVLLQAIASSPLLSRRKVVVIGDGPERERLIATATDMNLHNVAFVGAIAPDELHTFMKAAQVLAFPSLIEAFGIVTLEALAAGACIAGFNTGSIIDLIDSPLLNERIFSAPVGDVEALAKALKKAFEAEPENSLDSVCQYLQATYSWDKIADTHREIYDQIIRT